MFANSEDIPVLSSIHWLPIRRSCAFLDNLLGDEPTPNPSPQNESHHDTFYSKNDPLHHEFARGTIINPSMIAREHEEYLNLMALLCEISNSRSQENFHASPSIIIESLPTSPIPVEESNPVQEEIDIIPGPDEVIPPGVENDDSEDEDNSTLLPENESSILEPSSPLPPPEPPDVCLSVKPIMAVKNDFVMLKEDFYHGEKILSLNVEDVYSFTFIVWTFLLYFTYPKNSPLIFSFGSEDFVFDPGIVIFHFSYLKPEVFLMEASFFHNCSP
ncbi:hypothetical protein Tco_1042437 [Tanacetum coccineum]|uniref:Uncharacterized protein n=1 Tax=Tanacetum coccineum TaxID=301880 RepID=A0ABQ5GLD6_9ASTR